jgi:hypothetical protein
MSTFVSVVFGYSRIQKIKGFGRVTGLQNFPYIV